MRVSFEDAIAKEYGYEAAILFEHIRFSATFHSLPENREKYKYCYQEGRWWCYNSQKELCDMLHIKDAKTLRKIIKKLKDDGMILIGCFNFMKVDRTCWYTITLKGLKLLLESDSNYDYSASMEILSSNERNEPIGKNSPLQQGKNTQPIPNKYNTNKINNNIAALDKAEEISLTEEINNLIETFKEYFPIEDWSYKETALAATLGKLLDSYTESQIDDSIYIIGEHRRIIENPIGYLVSYMNLHKRLCS